VHTENNIAIYHLKKQEPIMKVEQRHQSQYEDTTDT